MSASYKEGLKSMHKVYIELVFLDNFTVDFLILLFAALLTRSKRRWTRLIISACAGGVYACAVFPGNGFGVSVVTKIAVGLIMCLIAYYDKYERAFFKNTCAFFITAFVFAGSVCAVSYSFGQSVASGLVLKPAARDILLGLGAAAALAGAFGRIRAKVLRREKYSEDLILKYKEKRVAVKAFIDTGNMLTEPISGLDVVLVTKNIGESLFGKEDIFADKDMGSDRLRVIPYNTEGGGGVMFGIEIDGITINGCDKDLRTVVCAAKGRLAGGCDALIGGALTDKLMGGLIYDKVGYKQDNSVDTCTSEGGSGSRLYQRERRPASTADPGGGDKITGASGEGGKIGKAHIN